MCNAMQTLVVAIVVLAALAGVQGSRLPSSSGAQLFISGGTTSDNGHLRFIVQIKKTNYAGVTHRGAGALLSKDWVLTTAASSTPGGWLTFESVKVHVGRSKGGAGTEVDVDLKKSVVEPNEKILKLLRLKESVVIDALTRPANLPWPGAQPNTGLPAVLAGWGEGEVLNAVTVNILTDTQCTEAGVQDVKATELCSMDPGTGACKGDDGSPLVQDLGNGLFRLVGVVTGADNKDGKCSGATVYVNVAQYTKWILNYVFS